PVPVEGMLALIKNVLLLHCSINASPASATVGEARLVMVTWSVVAVHVPFSTLHSRVTEVPAATAVTVVLASPGLVMFPLPETTLHVPVPVAGAVAAMLKVLVLHSS